MVQASNVAEIGNQTEDVIGADPETAPTAVWDAQSSETTSEKPQAITDERLSNVDEMLA